MRTGALSSLASLMIWLVVWGAVAWARPTPPASLFGRIRPAPAVVTVAEAPVPAAEAR